MPMLYQAMPNLYRAGAAIPLTIKIDGRVRWPCAVAHHAGATKLNDLIVATDCLAKTDTLGWNTPPPTEVCHEPSRSRRLVALSLIQPVKNPAYPGRRTT